MAPPGKSGEAALAVQAFAAAVAKYVRGKGCSSEGCSWKDCRSKALQLEGLQVGRTAGWKHCSWEDCRLELGQPEQDPIAAYDNQYNGQDRSNPSAVRDHIGSAGNRAAPAFALAQAAAQAALQQR